MDMREETIHTCPNLDTEMLPRRLSLARSLPAAAPAVAWRVARAERVRATAMKIGVPVVPGTPGAVAAYTEAHAFIEEYGFPGASRATAYSCRMQSHAHVCVSAQ